MKQRREDQQQTENKPWWRVSQYNESNARRKNEDISRGQEFNDRCMVLDIRVKKTMASSAASVSNESQDVSEVDSSTANGRIDAVRELARVVSVRNGLTNAVVVVSHDRKISKSSMETEATTTAGSEVPMPMTKNKNSFFIDTATDATATLKSMEKSTDLSDANISGDAADTTLGRWTAEEHEQFLHGMKVYGREWKKVRLCIITVPMYCFNVLRLISGLTFIRWLSTYQQEVQLRFAAMLRSSLQRCHENNNQKGHWTRNNHLPPRIMQQAILLFHGKTK